jgi:hypothetical protein
VVVVGGVSVYLGDLYHILLGWGIGPPML